MHAFSPFDTVQVGGAGAHVLTVAPHTHTTNNTRAYHCALPAPHGDVYFDLDDSQLHWEGEYIDNQQAALVHGQYDYLSGQVAWTSGMPHDFRRWVYGLVDASVTTGANHSTTHRTPRMVSVPPDEY